MSDPNAPPMPQPTAEHRQLLQYAGTWNVLCKFYMDPSQPPMEVQAKEIVEPVGEFWLVSKYSCDFMGAPFVGRSTLGYETHAKRYVSTWIDSMTPAFFQFTGAMKGSELHMEGMAFSCMTQSMLKHRTVDRFISKDEHVFEMYCTMPDGNECKMMTNHYKRA